MGTENRIAGEQLRLARLVHGYSLEQVAELIHATRQFIHQLETNARTPSHETVEALADVLGVTPKFLRTPVPSSVRPEQCHFRSLSNRPANVTSQILARGTILDQLASVLDHNLDLPAVDFPEIAAQTAAQIESAAEQARQHWGLGSGPITSMMRVVENAGAIVTYFGDLSERVDAFSMDRKRPIIVRSSLKESLFRQRFDLAHECGHLIMHRGLQTGDRVTEGQAHRFASALLFPRANVLREFPRGNRIDWSKLLELKKRWKMALSALVRRGYDLGILSPVQYRIANIHLSKTGQRKVEELDQDPRYAVEEPELLRAAFELSNEHFFGGASSLGRELGLEPRTLEIVTGLDVSDLPQDPKVVRLHF
jgi:Zn-dependent peptidase ImmA (M78 family)/DNA-binding XRE family transcriptional regulator